jgi:hypothetical protein
MPYPALQAAEQAALEQLREEEQRKLGRERRVLEQQSRALLKLPGKKERSAVAALEAVLAQERQDAAAREARHKLTADRLRRQVADLTVRGCPAAGPWARGRGRDRANFAAGACQQLASVGHARPPTCLPVALLTPPWGDLGFAQDQGQRRLAVAAPPRAALLLPGSAPSAPPPPTRPTHTNTDITPISAPLYIQEKSDELREEVRWMEAQLAAAGSYARGGGGARKAGTCHHQ